MTTPLVTFLRDITPADDRILAHHAHAIMQHIDRLVRAVGGTPVEGSPLLEAVLALHLKAAAIALSGKDVPDIDISEFVAQFATSQAADQSIERLIPTTGAWEVFSAIRDHDWHSLGAFGSLAVAAEHIRSLEGYAADGLFLEVFVDPSKDDALVLSNIKHAGPKRLYMIRRRAL